MTRYVVRSTVGSMSERLRLRRHLYEHHRSWRQRRMLKRQLTLLSAMPGDDGPAGGSAGVREPRRPYPPTSPAARELTPE